VTPYEVNGANSHSTVRTILQIYVYLAHLINLSVLLLEHVIELGAPIFVDAELIYIG
jgi:hypothetical protein